MSELREIRFDEGGKPIGSPEDIEFHREHVCNMNVEEADIRAIYTQPHLTSEGLDAEIKNVEADMEKAVSQSGHDSLKRRFKMLIFLREQMGKTTQQLSDYLKVLIDKRYSFLSKEQTKLDIEADLEAKKLEHEGASAKSILYSLKGFFNGDTRTPEYRKIEARKKEWERKANLKRQEIQDLLLKAKLVNLASRYRFLNKLP